MSRAGFVRFVTLMGVVSVALLRLTGVGTGPSVAATASLPPIPQVEVPQVPSTPSVPVPSVPSTPQVQVPEPSVPSTPQVPSASVPDVPSVTGAPPSGGGGTISIRSAGSPSSGSQSSDPSSATPSGSQPSGAAPVQSGSKDNALTASAGSAPGDGSSVQAEVKQDIPPATERHRVARMSRCFHVLSSFKRAVLFRRYGLAGHRPEPAAVVAEQLTVSTAHVHRAEHRAVAKLSRATAAGPGCGVGGSASVLSDVALPSSAPAWHPSARAGPSHADPRFQQATVRSADAMAAVAGRRAASLISRIDRVAESAPSEVWISLLVLAGAALTALVFQVGRDVRQGRGAPLS